MKHVDLKHTSNRNNKDQCSIKQGCDDTFGVELSCGNTKVGQLFMATNVLCKSGLQGAQSHK